MKKDLCTLKPNFVKNTRGLDVVPTLWKALDKYVPREIKETVGEEEIDPHYSKVRDTYAYTKTELFKRKYPDLPMDDCYMPKLSALLELPEVLAILGRDNILETLNKQYKSGIYSYDEAVKLVTSFNRNTSYNDKYMATMTSEKEGKVAFNIVEKTDLNILALKDFISLRKFKDILLYYLGKGGIAVKEGEALLDTYTGKYDTVNHKEVFDTLFDSIEWFDGKTTTLAEEAGHFIFGVASHHNSTRLLAERLERLLNDKRNEAILTTLFTLEELNSVKSQPNMGRELAGRLISKKLAKKNLYHTSGISNFIGRMFDRLWLGITHLFKQMSKIITRDTGESISYLLDVHLRLITLDAEALAYSFFHDNLDVRDAEKEILFHDEKARTREVNLVVERLRDLAIGLSNLNTNFYQFTLDKNDKNLAESVKHSMSNILSAGRVMNTVTDPKAIASALYNSVSVMIKELTELASKTQKYYNKIKAMPLKEAVLVDEITGRLRPNPEFDLILNAFNSLSALIQAAELTRSSVEALAAAKEVNPDIANIREFFHIDLKLTSLKESLDNIAKLRTELKEIQKGAINSVFTTILNGKDYITFEGVVMKGGKAIAIDEVHTPELAKVTIMDLLNRTYMGQDGNWWERWLQSATFSSDPIITLLDKVTSYNRMRANTENMRLQLLLFALEQEIKNLEYSTKNISTLGATEDADMDFFFEKGTLHEIDKEGNIISSKSGVFTGNIVSPEGLNWNAWELDFLIFKRKCIAEYKKAHEALMKNMNTQQRAEAVYSFFKPKYLLWHNQHSDKYSKKELKEIYGEDVDTSEMIIWKPKKFRKDANGDLVALYKDDTFENLEKNQLILIKKYLKIKAELDKKVNKHYGGSATLQRAPQFRANILQRFKQANGGVASVTNTLGTELIAAFAEDILDYDFGGNSTFNNTEDYFFNGIGEELGEKYKRIPMFGINKLKDMSTLSHNLVYSTMAYGAMANNVDCLNNSAEVAYSLQDALKGRSLGWTGIATDKNGTTITWGNGRQDNDRKKSWEDSNFHGRLEDFIEMQIFGQYQSKGNVLWEVGGHKILLGKLVRSFNRLATWDLLNGKLGSGRVNTNTAVIQLFKEGIIGEHFTKKEVLKAYGEYVRTGLGTGFQPIGKSFTNSLYNTDKVTIFSRFFDAINENLKTFRNMDTQMPWMFRWNWGAWCYASGTHMSMVVPCVAKGYHIKLYKISDKETANATTGEKSRNYEEAGNVYDLFDETLLTKEMSKDSNPWIMEEGKSWVLKEGKLGFNLEEDYELVNSEDVKGRIKYRKVTDLNGNVSMRETTREDFVYFIKNKKGEFVEWNPTEWVRFNDLHRRLTDNLYGLYNNYDSVAFSKNWKSGLVLSLRKFIFGYSNTFFLKNKWNASDETNTEGAVMTWATMLQYYWLNNNKEQFSKLMLMGVPWVMSMAGSIAGCQTWLFVWSGVIAPAMYKFLGANIRKNMASDFSKPQLDSFKRFYVNVFQLNILHMIAMLFAKNLGDWDDEEDYESLDAKILDTLGVDDYELHLIMDNKHQLNKKASGLAYSYFMSKVIDDSDKIDLRERMLGYIYYFSHRANLEQATLFPFGADKGIFSEMSTLAREQLSVNPVVSSFMLGTVWGGLFLKSLQDNYDEGKNPYWNEAREEELEKNATFPYNPLAYYLYKLRHELAGEGRGRNFFVNKMLPYFNSTGFLVDPYNAAKGYDFGRVSGQAESTYY